MLPALFSLSLLFIAFYSYGQQPTALLFRDSVTVIGELRDGWLYGGPDLVVNNLLGNTVYQGESTAREDMVYLVAVQEPFGKKDQYIYFQDGQQEAFTISKGVLYLGNKFNEDLEKLIVFSPPYDNTYYDLYSGLDNAYLGTIAATEQLRPAELFLCLHQYVLHYDLDRLVNARIQTLYPGTTSPGDSLTAQVNQGRMRPYMDTNPYYEWEWDGKTLKPVWGIRSEDEWSFDGQYIRPLFGLVSRQEWIWDGTTLKPYWNPDPGMQWIWDRGILRRFWNGLPEEEWKITEDGMVSPHWSYDPTRSWVIEGQFPLPLVALIILGVADR